MTTVALAIKANHSLIVTDVQGELTPYILAIAGITNHSVLTAAQTLAQFKVGRWLKSKTALIRRAAHSDNAKRRLYMKL